MVQAVVNIPEKANHILSIIKARYKLKDKSEAISKIVLEYGEELLEPELRPEYILKLDKIEKEGYGKSFSSVEELRKHLEK